MKILRVFNNNVVLAKDGAREVIVTGRGLGFQAKPGQRVDDAKIVRVSFRPTAETRTISRNCCPRYRPEIIRTGDGRHDRRPGLAEQAESQPTLVMALADHITGAVQRAQRHVNIAYPLQAEVQSLYASEYAQASRLVNELNRHLNGVLPGSEAVALALHLVNAGFANGDLSDTYKMTGVIQQMLTIIEQTYGVSLDQHSVNVGRFITHLRYLFVRIHQGKQLDKEPEPIIASIRQSYPKAMQCAQTIGTVASLRLGSNLTEDEVAYLALHVARVVADARKHE